jgi:hypothetical protein
MDKTFSEVESALIRAEKNLNERLVKVDDESFARPANGGWSALEIAEHVTLTNHYLLKVIRKHTDRALSRAANMEGMPDEESNLEKMERVGIQGSFEWPHPGHMTPTGKQPICEIRAVLQEQFNECLAILHKLKNGEGHLAKITLNVDNLGKMDLYQWLYFVAQHAERHCQQLDRLND